MATFSAPMRQLLPLTILVLLAIFSTANAKPAAPFYLGWAKRSAASRSLSSTRCTQEAAANPLPILTSTQTLARRKLTTIHLTSTIATVTKIRTKTLHAGTKTMHHHHHKHTRHDHHTSKPHHAQKTRYAKDAAARATPAPAHKAQRRDDLFFDDDEPAIAELLRARNPKETTFDDDKDADGNRAASDRELNAVFLTAAAKDDEILEADSSLAAGVSSSFVATGVLQPA